MNSEGLDKIFRDGLAEREVEFNMDAWHKMEKMLPPEAAQKKGGWWSYAWRAAGVFAVAIIGFFAFDFVTSPVDSDRESTTPITQNMSQPGNEVSTAATVDSENETATPSATMPVEQPLSLTEESLTEIQVAPSNTNGSAEAEVPIAATSHTSPSASAAISAKEPVGFIQNAFTKITGIGELSASLLASNEVDETIVVADMKSTKQSKPKQNELGFIGGANLNPAVGANASAGWKVSEFAGITYTRHLSGGLGVKANLLYSRRNNMQTSKVQSVKRYGFGSNIETTTLHTNSLFYLDLPVMVNYGFGNGNIMLGAQPSILLNGYHTLKTTNMDLTGEFSSTETKEFGYTDGYNPFDVSLVVGYEHSITPQISVGGRFNYGLFDMTNNAYFNDSAFDRNTQFRVYLTYSPFRF